MSLIREDRIAETTTGTGTGALTTAGAVPGFKSFGSVCQVGDTFYGSIEAIDASGVPSGDFEDGLFTYTAANQITRTTVIRSSNANAAVNFTAGTKRIYIAMSAAAFAALANLTPSVAPYQASAKYWRIYVPTDALTYAAAGTNNWVAIGEIMFKDASGTLLTTGCTAMQGSQFNATFKGSLAFDGVLPAGDNGWISRDGSFSNTSGDNFILPEVWVGCANAAAITPTQVTLYPLANYPTGMPTKFNVDFSLDGRNWISLAQFTTTTPAVGTPQTFQLPQYAPTMLVSAPATTTAYRFGGFAASAITASEILMDHEVVSACTLGVNFAGAQASVGTPPAGTWTATVLLNGTSIGSLTISTGGVPTFTLTGGGTQALAVGDVVTLVAPGSADASIARLRFTFSGLLVPGTAAPWYLTKAPKAASLTLVSGDGTNLVLVDDPDVGLTFDGGAPATGDHIRGAELTIPNPSANWTLTARLDFIIPVMNYSTFGLTVRDSAGGKLLVFGSDQNGGVIVNRITALAGPYSAGPFGQTIAGGRPTWWRVAFTASNTTLSFYSSVDGKVWALMYSETVAAFLTNNPTRVGFGTECNRSSGPNIVGSVGYLQLA